MTAPAGPLPRVTSDRACCPECRQPAPYLPNGLPDWHLSAGELCMGVLPAYVIGRPRRAGRP